MTVQYPSNHSNRPTEPPHHVSQRNDVSAHPRTKLNNRLAVPSLAETYQSTRRIDKSHLVRSLQPTYPLPSSPYTTKRLLSTRQHLTYQSTRHLFSHPNKTTDPSSLIETTNQPTSHVIASRASTTDCTRPLMS